MPELKPLPCPACGSEVHITGGDSWHNQNRFWIECTCEVCRLGDTERDECIERWNSLPRALTWGEEPPTVEGWYWFSVCQGHAVCIPVGTDGKAKLAKDHFTDAELLGGQWAGPIAPPAEQK